MTSSAFWCLAPKELDALTDMYNGHIRRWAVERAMYANVHFRGEFDAAWEPDHFMGKPRESVRVEGRAAVQHMLKLMTGDRPEDIPDWAKPRVN